MTALRPGCAAPRGNRESLSAAPCHGPTEEGEAGVGLMLGLKGCGSLGLHGREGYPRIGGGPERREKEKVAFKIRRRQAPVCLRLVPRRAGSVTAVSERG